MSELFSPSVPRSRALDEAAAYAVRAPSVHNTQPWELVLRPDRLLLRADRTRQLSALDPRGRELVLSVGAALCNARVALAHGGWAVEVERIPSPADPDLLATLRIVPGEPDASLAALAPWVTRRHTNRRGFSGAPVPDDVLRRLTGTAEAEGVLLIPVLTDAHRRLVARLTQQADGLQNADPAYRAELRHWTTRTPADGDGVPPEVVPHVDGRQQDDVPLRDFDTGGTGALPAETHSDADQTMVLLATRADDQVAWLRAGETLQQVLLELTRLGWVAGPVTQAIEVPLTRTQLRAALAWDAHPQLLLRIGHAADTAATPRRPHDDVVIGGRPAGPRPLSDPPAPTIARQEPAAAPAEPGPDDHPHHRPVSDGRGGTIWI